MYLVDNSQSNIVSLDEYAALKEQNRRINLANNPIERYKQMRSVGWDEMAISLFDPERNEVGVPTVFNDLLRHKANRLYQDAQFEGDSLAGYLEESLQPDMSFDWELAYNS